MEKRERREKIQSECTFWCWDVPCDTWLPVILMAELCPGESLLSCAGEEQVLCPSCVPTLTAHPLCFDPLSGSFYPFYVFFFLCDQKNVLCCFASVSFWTFFNQGLSWLCVRGKLQQLSEKNQKKRLEKNRKKGQKKPQSSLEGEWVRSVRDPPTRRQREAPGWSRG